MSKLKKGDLVMTEDGLAWYVKFYTLLGYRVILISGNYYFVEICLPATRTQVEAKIKDMGWELRGTSGILRKKGSINTSVFEQRKEWVVTAVFNNYTFDTAPAELNEAILVARLLNATKNQTNDK